MALTTKSFLTQFISEEEFVETLKNQFCQICENGFLGWNGVAATNPAEDGYLEFLNLPKTFLTIHNSPLTIYN